MPGGKSSYRKSLAQYIVGEESRAGGECDMHCPLHSDGTRSASINFDKNLWVCHASCGGGTIDDLVTMRDEWVDPPQGISGSTGEATETINQGKISGWASALLSPRHKDRFEALTDARGLTEETLVKFQIGWDSNLNAYTIPIFDIKGEILNVRRYQIDRAIDRRKIWSVAGMGKSVIYPIEVLADANEVIVCEGEWDALLTIQSGYAAVTRTGGAKEWNAEWNNSFNGKHVYLCHDADDAGRDGNLIVERALTRHASEISQIQLPFEHQEKHGKDLTDYWLENPGGKILSLSKPGKLSPVKVDPTSAAIIDSYDSRLVGKPLELNLTIKGRRNPGYTVPKTISYVCSRDAGNKCVVCPLHGAGGQATLDIEAKSPTVLKFIESTDKQVSEALREEYGVPRCSKLSMSVDEYQAVEILIARPSVDHVNKDVDPAEYANLKITSVGKHDTLSNNNVKVIGSLYPDPKKQSNEFLAWDVTPTDTSIDKFRMSPEAADVLRKFRPRGKQRPIAKYWHIAKHMAEHVTKIYGRNEMHAAMDLAFHSVLSFEFGGRTITRGWVEILIVGDTRTGKSAAASALSDHYGVGEVVSCEASSYAGLVGGLQQYGSSKEWAVTWGSLPMNDARLVVLDEISGITTEEIGAMSSVRSSGVAQITKVVSDQTSARVRTIWIGNPRDARMGEFTYGVQAIKQLIGNNEDVARFDLAMSVREGEVAAEEINRQHEPGDLIYDADSCNTLIKWIWSRKSDQIKWDEGAQEQVYKSANSMGARYVESPPLVQVADVREKIARMSVALAARLASATEDWDSILVTKEHVMDTVALIDHIYGMKNFGYAELSKEIKEDQAEARAHRKDITLYLADEKRLSKFLRSTGSFRRADLEEILNIDKQDANAKINRLWNSRMIRKERGDIKVEPLLHEILRDVK